MKIWQELDETTKKYIQILLIVIFVLGTILLWYFGNSATRQLNAPMVVFRSPLKEVRLINAEEKDGFYKVSVLDLATSKRYDDINISKICPDFRNPVGQKMYVGIVKVIRPVTNEESYEMERVYDYICTKKNMSEADGKLEDELKKSLKEDMELKPNNENVK